MAELLHVRGYFAQAVAGSKPIKFRGRIIPEFFTCTFYIIDNDGIKVNKENAKSFKTWTLELTLRATSSETVEPVAMSVLGARKFTGHNITIFSSKPQETKLDGGTINARYFNLLQENRARFISYATTNVLQTVKYKKVKNGHSWTLNDFVDISETELSEIARAITNSSYTKLDGNFYQEFADRYKALILEGEKHPIKALQALYYPFKSVKHVQSYATEARKRGLIAKADDGKNSPVRKIRKAGK